MQVFFWKIFEEYFPKEPEGLNLLNRQVRIFNLC